MIKNSFNNGFLQLRLKDTKDVQQKIMLGLNITARSSWRNRLKGFVIPTETEIIMIEQIFAEYEIINTWGDDRT